MGQPSTSPRLPSTDVGGREGRVLDRLGRPVEDLRISVTDRCNLRCRYCMPREVFGADHAFLPRDELLSFEELERVVRVAVSLGVTKLRLTGGEPLLRTDLPELVAMLTAIDGVEDLALTTNGLLLPQQAQALADAGLHRLTVSLDAIDEATFRQVADTRASVTRVLEGIEAARAAGLDPIKVNTVLTRGANDDQLEDLAGWARDARVTLRFIEFMDVGTTNGWLRDRVVPADEIVRRIDARWPIEARDRVRPGEVAETYRYRDGAGEVGVVASVTRAFCRECTRARLSAIGELFTCLFAGSGHDLRSLLRDEEADDEALRRRLVAIWSARTDRASELRAEEGLSGPRVEMSYIGG